MQIDTETDIDELARQDENVIDINAKKAKAKKPKFENTYTDWKKNLTYDIYGVIHKKPANARLILKNDEQIKDKFSFDMTTGTAYKTKGLPWSAKDDSYTTSDKKMMSDGDFKSLYNFFHDKYNFSSTTIIDNVFAEYCMEIQHNPLIDFLNGLPVWDGIPRVDTLLIDYLNAGDTEYVRAVTRKTLTALLRRAYSPGCKYDTCLILKGKQGLGKSTLFSILGGEWYTDEIKICDDKAKTYESHKGKWLCELGELDGMRKAESERTKAFMVAQKDSYRPPYARNIIDTPRMSITVGTTNSDQFLKDITGNRRFWTVEIFEGGIKNVWNDLPREREQILAEAKMIHKTGEQLHLPKELEETASLIQAEFLIQDPWYDEVLNYLDIVLPVGWSRMNEYIKRDYIDKNKTKTCGNDHRKIVCIEEIWIECLHGKIENLTPQINNRIRDIMSQAKKWTAFKNARQFTGYGRKRGWERIETNT